MKSNFLFAVLTAFLLSSPLTIFGQNEQKSKGQQNRPTFEQVEQKQCNRMVKELMLDDVTSAKFIPIYKQYLEDIKACKLSKYKRNMKERDNKVAQTDADIEKMIKDQFEQTRRMVDIQEKYYIDLQKILTPKQILKIYRPMSQRMFGGKGFNHQRRMRPNMKMHQINQKVNE